MGKAANQMDFRYLEMDILSLKSKHRPELKQGLPSSGFYN